MSWGIDFRNNYDTSLLGIGDKLLYLDNRVDLSRIVGSVVGDLREISELDRETLRVSDVPMQDIQRSLLHSLEQPLDLRDRQEGSGGVYHNSSVLVARRVLDDDWVVRDFSLLNQLGKYIDGSQE